MYITTLSWIMIGSILLQKFQPTEALKSLGAIYGLMNMIVEKMDKIQVENRQKNIKIPQLSSASDFNIDWVERVEEKLDYMESQRFGEERNREMRPLVANFLKSLPETEKLMEKVEKKTSEQRRQFEELIQLKEDWKSNWVRMTLERLNHLENMGPKESLDEEVQKEVQDHFKANYNNLLNTLQNKMETDEKEIAEQKEEMERLKENMKQETQKFLVVIFIVFMSLGISIYAIITVFMNQFQKPRCPV